MMNRMFMRGESRPNDERRESGRGAAYCVGIQEATGEWLKEIVLG